MQSLLIKDEFISAQTSQQALAVIDSFRRNVRLPIISRPSARRPLCYSVIDGHQIRDYLPEIHWLNEKTTALIQQIFGSQLEPLADTQVACNINITQPGGSYRYHYDRNAVTAILYLNETSGGETECYPDHRLWMRGISLQREADRVFESEVFRWMFGKQVVVRPRAGRLLVMRGNRCLHSVREVNGSCDRINIVMAYDVRGAQPAANDHLNSYLYTPESVQSSDPNYA